jgi:ketosteroid isomerase-like protein
MTVLLENPVVIAVVGGLLATMAAVVFLSRRNLESLVALVAVVAVTLLLLVVERFVVTDREAVEYALEDMLAAIEANDTPGVLAWIDPTATGVRDDVQTLMPMVKVKVANAGAVDVEVTAPGAADCNFQAYLQGTHGSSGSPLAYINQRVNLNWVKQGDRWLVKSYAAYYDGDPINAVNSARGNRAVP